MSTRELLGDIVDSKAVEEIRSALDIPDGHRELIKEVLEGWISLGEAAYAIDTIKLRRWLKLDL